MVLRTMSWHSGVTWGLYGGTGAGALVLGGPVERWTAMVLLTVALARHTAAQGAVARSAGRRASRPAVAAGVDGHR